MFCVPEVTKEKSDYSHPWSQIALESAKHLPSGVEPLAILVLFLLLDGHTFAQVLTWIRPALPTQCVYLLKS